MDDDALGTAALVAVGLVNAVAMLVIAPLGLRLLGLPQLRTLATWWPLPAGAAAAALLLPAGWPAGLLSVPYLLATLAAVILGGREPWLRLVPLAALPVAAIALVANRGGLRLFGFEPGVLALTVAHFHVAGFGALLLLVLLASAEPSRSTRLASVAAPLGVSLVGVGFLFGRVAGERAGDGVELAGAAVLTAALWLALAARPARRQGPGPVTLGAVAGLTMTLALAYAGGSFLGLPHPTLDWMVAGHGVLNAGAVLSAITLVWWDRPDRPMRTGRFRHPVGTGPARFQAASEALLTWDMHRGAGARVDPDAPRAAVGVRMVSRLGVGPFRLSEPCEVIEVVSDGRLTVMHYLALPGHLFEGDERFAISLDDDGRVWLDVSVRSRPVQLLAKAGGPLVPIGQRLFIRLCARSLRRA